MTPSQPKRVELKEKVLKENERIASEIRRQLNQHGIASLNLVSSPGSGKTSLLERTFQDLGQELRLAVIVGDVQTENDARRLEAAGAKAVRPLVTGGACHLDAVMVRKALDGLNLTQCDLLFVENVGNLVCPASYDLGEDMKVVLISTTEGDDKPLKYPSMFRRSSLMVINKIDLLGYSDFDVERVKSNARRINDQIEILEVSCRTGAGLPAWYDWLKSTIHRKQKVPARKS